jgi:hypothetical protein
VLLVQAGHAALFLLSASSKGDAYQLAMHHSLAATCTSGIFIVLLMDIVMQQLP